MFIWIGILITEITSSRANILLCNQWWWWLSCVWPWTKDLRQKYWHFSSLPRTQGSYPKTCMYPFRQIELIILYPLVSINNYPLKSKLYSHTKSSMSLLALFSNLPNHHCISRIYIYMHTYILFNHLYSYYNLKVFLQSQTTWACSYI